MKDFSKVKPSKAPLSKSEMIVGGDADKKMINDRKNLFIKLFKDLKNENKNRR